MQEKGLTDQRLDANQPCGISVLCFLNKRIIQDYNSFLFNLIDQMDLDSAHHLVPIRTGDKNDSDSADCYET